MNPPGQDLQAARRPGAARGSVLLTAMLLAIALAVVLGSYLSLGRTALKVAQRSYFANDAANLAEAGIEEALYRFNLMGAGTAAATAWSGWTLAGANAQFTLPAFNRDQNAVGIVKVYVAGYDGNAAAPTVIAQATLTTFDGSPPISKTMQVTLKKNTPVYGIVTLGSLTFNSTASADSFNSNPTQSPTGPWAAYSSANASSQTSVAVLSGSIYVASGKIYGDLKLGPGVSAPPTSDYTGTLTTGFTASYPLPAYPTAASVSQSYNLGSSIPSTLPVVGHLPASDGRYYYFCNSATIGAVTISAGKNVTIVGTSTGMSGGMVIQNLGSCIVYLSKPVTVASGRSINNTNWAGALLIYTSTTSSCTFANNSRFTGRLYAPNSRLTATGTSNSASLTGWVVVKSISAAGSVGFHFDRALLPSGSGNVWRITSWLELQSAADRAAVAGRTGNFLH
ncbi:MAG: hypothetical protein HYV95_15030 [Opitutae bacterium]|nr:hypothetical protein [Opitutae bacterium]